MSKTAQHVEESKEKKPLPERISFKQRRTRFVREFLKDRNATRAALAAGYAPKSAHVSGCRLLKDYKVREKIDAANAKYNADIDVSVKRVRLELARLAFFDPRSFFTPDGSLKPLNELTTDEAAAIAGLDLSELFSGDGEDRNNIGYLKKIKLVDKLEALDKLGRHLKMFTDKVEISGDQDLMRALLAGRKRAKERNGGDSSST